MSRFKVELKAGHEILTQTWEGLNKESVAISVDYYAFDYGLEVLSIETIEGAQ